MKFLVYRTSHRASGRFYIGKTTRHRWERGYIGSGAAVEFMVVTYGKNALEREILFETDDEREAYAYESGAVRIALDSSVLCLNRHAGKFGRKPVINKNLATRRKNYKNHHPNQPFTMCGIRFETNRQAAKYFGVCRGTIKNWKKHPYLQPKQKEKTYDRR